VSQPSTPATTDACELVEVYYDALPPVPTGAAGLGPASTPLFDNLGDNAGSRTGHEYGPVAETFARAHRVLGLGIEQHGVARAVRLRRGRELPAATFMDYLLPTATKVPTIEIHHLETAPLDPDVNFRGVGEGGLIVAPATIVNAVEDALSPFGVRILEQHLPPARILELIASAAPTSGAARPEFVL
jgi:CO/xanthine dehydrogenase Mo-binding subunit